MLKNSNKNSSYVKDTFFRKLLQIEIYDGISKLFGSPTVKWRLFNIFCKITRKVFHLLILPKLIHLRDLIWLRYIILANIKWKFVNEHYIKVLVTVNGPLKTRSCHFWFFRFFNFNMSFVKNFMKKLPALRRIFKVCLKFYYVTQSFRISKFLTLTWRPF